MIRCPGATTTPLWKHLEKHHVDESTRRGRLNTDTLEILTLLKPNRKVIVKFGQDIEDSKENDTEEDCNKSADSSGGDLDENSSGETVDGEYSDEEVTDTDDD